MNRHLFDLLSMLPRVLLCAGLLAGLWACAEPIGMEPLPTVGTQSEALPSSTRPPRSEGATTTPDGLLRIVYPADGATLQAGRLVVRGEALARRGIGTVRLAVGPNEALPVETGDGYRSWEAGADLRPGTWRLRATLLDPSGSLLAEQEQLVHVEGRVRREDDALLRIDAPAQGAEILHADVVVRGSSEGVDLVRMEVRRDGELLEAAVRTPDFFRTWSVRVPVLPGREHDIEVSGVSADEERFVDVVRVTTRPATPAEPPRIGVIDPAPDSAWGDALLPVLLQVESAEELRSVSVRRLADTGPTPWEEAEALPAGESGEATHRAELFLPAGGSHVFEGRVISASGQSARAQVTVVSTREALLGEERSWTLRLREDVAPSLLFELDRAQVDEVISPALQEDILLVELSSRPLLINILDEIKSACGERWREDNANPRHDCSLTPLGQTFAGPDGRWETSAEYALVRLLTMTPANVQVAGTSIAGLQNLADGAILGITIGGGFSQILADALGIPRTREIIPTDAVADAFRLRFVASHPESNAEGDLRITLRDALTELQDLGATYGPSQGHPGVVDPEAPTFARLLREDFAMVLGADSNLRWVEGIELARGKEYMALIGTVDDEEAPPVLAFDFLDPARFDFVGLVDDPTADLRFRIPENPAFIPSCNGRDACIGNLPESPLDETSLWALPPWELEYLVAYAALLAYEGRRYSRCLVRGLVFCYARIDIGSDSEEGEVDDDPPGWTRFYVFADIANPPRDQYVWELITEIAQVALHRLPETTIPEGEADVAFTVTDIPVGVSATELRQAVRPVMQAQAASISERLLGGYRENNAALDFYLRAGRDGHLRLWFTGEDDPLPSGAGGWRRPGFFADEALGEADRLSRPPDTASGGRSGEQLRLQAGTQTLWVEDAGGTRWRLRVEVDDPSRSDAEVVVHAAPLR